jgi:hypothetical protein
VADSSHDDEGAKQCGASEGQSTHGSYLARGLSRQARKKKAPQGGALTSQLESGLPRVGKYFSGLAELAKVPPPKLRG